MAKPRTVDDARRDLLETARVFRRLFTTPDGQEVLAHLEERFGGERPVRPAKGSPVDPYQLAINHGAREPVRLIRELMAFADKEEEPNGGR